MGVGWTVAEDTIDRYVIRRIEGRVENPVIRALVQQHDESHTIVR
jgi:hypothetical protein